MKPMYEYTAEIINVIDGNMIDLKIDLGFNLQIKTRVILARINAPQIFGVFKDSPENQKGVASLKFIEDFAQMTNNKVRIVSVKDKHVKYNSYLVEVFALEGAFKDKNLNDEMLTYGFAVEYTG